MKKTILTFCLSLIFLSTAAAASKKVLYITHEPGKWHKYTPQLAMFKEISKQADWDLTVWTGEHHAQVEKLKTLDFGKGYDAIVYNFCFATERDLDACHNLMKQTRENGVPAMLIHCAMHSFWATYKPDRKAGMVADGKVHSDPELLKAWAQSHPGEAFPVWGDFTGVASTKHNHRAPIEVVPLKEHPVTASLGKGYTTGKAELYNNYYVLDTVIPLIEGRQVNKAGKPTKAIVMWECPQGKSIVLGLSLGHDLEEWKASPFQYLIKDGVNYLINQH